MRIAILGATGHISKCAVSIFGQNRENELFLFSRSKQKLHKMISEFSIDCKYTLIEGYEKFDNYDYDLIFNGTGFWDTPGCDPIAVFLLTEQYDNMVLKYQKEHKETKAIHISSGAAYAQDYLSPVDDGTKTQIDINNIQEGDYYSIAKINSEAKHRANSDLSIVDLRLFGFFSRYMSLEYKYFLSAMINSVKNSEVFSCVGGDFWRDYIHMNDFAALLYSICNRNQVNTAIDVKSSKPITRNKIIDLFVREYGLKVRYTDDRTLVSRTGTKPYYYSLKKNNIYSPEYSSEETLCDELKYFL